MAHFIISINKWITFIVSKEKAKGKDPLLVKDTLKKIVKEIKHSYLEIINLIRT